MIAMREKWIDGIKGLSICAIILTHCGFYELPGRIGTLCSSGQLFVSVFFIISSYLAFQSYSRHITKSPSPFKWIIRKFILIIPIYFIALALGTVLGGHPFWLGEERIVSPLNILTHITFLSGLFPHYCNSIIGVEWYIGVLALFYLFTPLLYRWLTSAGKAFLTFVLSSVFLSLFILIASRYIPEVDGHIYRAFINRFSFITELPVLLLGICLFHIESNERNCESYLKSPATRLALLLLGFILLAGEVLGKNALYRIPSISLQGFAFFCIICFVMTQHTRLIENPLFLFLGKHTYPLYLFHYPLILLYERFVPNKTESLWVSLSIKYIIILCITAVLSFFLIRYIQNPLQKRVNRLVE